MKRESMVPRETSAQDLLNEYRELVLKWNRRIPLVSRKDPEAALDRLLAHSIEAEKHLPDKIKTLVDIGSGGGLPGIPLGILRSDMKARLVERSSNKCLFLRNAAIHLGLDSLEVINESWQPAHMDSSGPLAVTSLGVGEYQSLTAEVWPFFRQGDGLLLFISRKLCKQIAADVSCETWMWQPLEKSRQTGVAWLQKD